MNVTNKLLYLRLIAAMLFMVLISITSNINNQQIHTPLKDPLLTYSSANSSFTLSGRQLWETEVPQIQEVVIGQSCRKMHLAQWHNPPTQRDRPLIVVLNSNGEYHFGSMAIALAKWAVENGWVFIHPSYCSDNGRSSKPAVSAPENVYRALQYAMKHASVDSSRVYITGLGSGALAALYTVLVYPELFAAVSIWGLGSEDGRGDRPDSSGILNFDLIQSSWPEKISKLNSLIDAGKTALYIAHGIDDTVYSALNSVKLFGVFGEEGSLSVQDHRYIAGSEKHSHRAVFADSLYSKAGVDLVFRKEHNSVRLSLFRGGQDIVYNACLYWMAQQSSAN